MLVQCLGGLDIYIIFDESGSIGDFTPDYLFAHALTQQFDSTRTRFAFVVFSTTARIVTPLTSDRAAIANGLSVLQNTKTGGNTYFHNAFQLVLDMMPGDATTISAVFFLVLSTPLNLLRISRCTNSVYQFRYLV